MTMQMPRIRPMLYSEVLSSPNPVAWVCDGWDFTFGIDNEERARIVAQTYDAGGFWRVSRCRALIEALDALGWPHCTLARAKGSSTISVQLSTRRDSLPILADLVAGGDQPALRTVLERMDDFRLHPTAQWLSFRFPAHWAPHMLVDSKSGCAECRGTGAGDYSFLAIDPCPCTTAVAVMTSEAEWPPIRFVVWGIDFAAKAPEVAHG